MSADHLVVCALLGLEEVLRVDLLLLERDERRRGDGHGAIQKSSERKVGECCKTHWVALGVALGFSTERSYFSSN